jgi:predicted phosphodiesterase
MRVAAIYDIHGNLPALEAVLQDIRESKVDHVVVGGDVVPGPLPRETLKCLLDLHISMQFIYGNCEVAVLEQRAVETYQRSQNSIDPSFAGPRCNFLSTSHCSLAGLKLFASRFQV